ncbi:MAG: hypothetical protein JNK77_12580, partial [Saprospiraceae bacterium]|nr:hypothetical protein [Saprospiraceae bacterium]
MKTYFTIILVALVSTGTYLWLRPGQTDQSAQSLFDTFVQEQPLEMTITTDFSTLLADRNIKEAQGATVAW